MNTTAEVTQAQEERRLALIERLGKIADLCCTTPLQGVTGDVAYDMLREAAAQISSDRLHLAHHRALSGEPHTPVEGWQTITADRALYVDEGLERILSDRLPSPITLVLKNPSQLGEFAFPAGADADFRTSLADRGDTSATHTPVEQSVEAVGEIIDAIRITMADVPVILDADREAAARGILALITPSAPKDAIAETVAEERKPNIAAMAEFLIARIDDLDWCDFERFCNDWNGHVNPPLSRLRHALSAIRATEDRQSARASSSSDKGGIVGDRARFIGWIADHFQSRHKPDLPRDQALRMAAASLEAVETDTDKFGHPDYDWSEDGAVAIAQEEIDSCWEFEA